MSKGGTTSGSTEIPAWLENAAIENINKARDVSQIGYTPYYGPDVAAFNPMQTASFDATGSAANAFGLGGGSSTFGTDGIQAPQTFAGGMRGYSSAPIYEQALSQLEQNRPAQYSAINNMFIDPFTGAKPQGNYAATPEQVSQMFNNGNGIAAGGDGDGAGTGKSPYGNDANMEHLARMEAERAANAAAVAASIYSQNNSGDLTNGDTFVGNDGIVATVGGGDGQVDSGLANAAAASSIDSVRSDGSAIGSIIGNTLQDGLLSTALEYITGVVPFNSSSAPVGSLSNSDVSSGKFNGMVGMEQAEADRIARETAGEFSGLLSLGPPAPAMTNYSNDMGYGDTLSLLPNVSALTTAPAYMNPYGNDHLFGSGYNAMASPPPQQVAPLLTIAQMMSNPTLFDPAANAAVKAIAESSPYNNNGYDRDRINDFQGGGGGGASSAAMGSGTAKRGFNFGL